MSEVKFEREPRYLVIKLSKLDGGYASGSLYPDAKLAKKIEDLAGNALVDCVVVEADWPEYEPVWEMIESRMAGYPSLHPQRLRADTAEAELKVTKQAIASLKNERASDDRKFKCLGEILGLLKDHPIVKAHQLHIDAALNPNPEAESHAS